MKIYLTKQQAAEKVCNKKYNFKIKMMILMFCFLFIVILSRLFNVCSTVEYKNASYNQSIGSLTLFENRGFIYDCNFEPLVNAKKEYCYIINPAKANFDDVINRFKNVSNEYIKSKFKENSPFFLKSSEKLFDEMPIGITQEETFTRYLDSCTHLVGYTKENDGIAGLEQAYNGFMKENIWNKKLFFEKNARGFTTSESYEIEEKKSKTGVVTTIDKSVQKICEDAFRKSYDKGAVVVMECETGNILALASFPSYDPEKIALSMNRSDSPLVNKTFASYDLGSVFKLVVAASALENGILQSFTNECKGFYSNEDGSKIDCSNKQGHGVVDMQKAIEQSCNPYFISLAKELGVEKLLATASLFRLGKYTEFAKGFADNGGLLPNLKSLEQPGDFANFSFGQGGLLVTPVQVAAIISAIANGGNYVYPALIKGISNFHGTAVETFEKVPAAQRIISYKTSSLLCEYMEKVVSNGSGFKAKSDLFSSCGKTGSAETGWLTGNKKMVQGWFAGYFPYAPSNANKKYTAIILCENGSSGAMAAAPIFKEISEQMFKKGYFS